MSCTWTKQFEASYNHVMVPIPVHIWEVIRRYAGVDLSFAEKTDDELRQYVENQVDERITRYRESERNAQGLIRIFESLVYGTADTPREQQVEEGIVYFTKLREHQQQIKKAIAELEKSNMRE